MKSSTRQIWYYVLGTALVTFLGCGPKVRVPPNINLKVYDDIGMIEFSSNAKGNLHAFVTQKFLQSIQSAQPGVRILELGNSERVLSAVRHDQVDADAIKAIGEEYGVDAVITGHMDISNVKPKVELSSVLKSMKVRADVEAALTVRS